MILLSLILILLVGGVSSWIVARRHVTAARWIAVASVGADLLVTVGLWIANTGRSQPETGRWLEECNFDWIPEFGIRLHLALDGLSLALLLLTYFLGIVAILSSWTEIRQRIGFFHFNLLWVLAGITGVFLAEDLFVFYLFWADIRRNEVLPFHATERPADAGRHHLAGRFSSARDRRLHLRLRTVA
jgi:NADH-quinone oxidoreductase subunit M